MRNEQKFTARQVVEILSSTPLAFIEDETVLRERRKISAMYSRIKSTPRLFKAEELCGTQLGKDGEDKMLVPGNYESSVGARVQWLEENVL